MLRRPLLKSDYGRKVGLPPWGTAHFLTCSLLNVQPTANGEAHLADIYLNAWASKTVTQAWIVDYCQDQRYARSYGV
jgi:hypothetical protein